MPIELHCAKCGKLIRAPESAGGKHGKCPYCMESVYVPMPPEDDGVIPLAPLDEDEERRAAEERREAVRFSAVIDKLTDTPGGAEPAGRGKAAAAGGAPRRGTEDAPGQVIDLAEEVERFVLAMRDSKLDAAEAAAGRLRKTGTRGKDYVEGLMLDEMPPTFANVPPALVQGFLKALVARLT
ncbi:MAG: hypothetical protein HY763_00785 [Planctomycetes bacterium]|nr:hypothetical protein [Planctomycetota bacterium]